MLLGHTLYAVAILVIVGLNAAFEFYQEYRSEESLAALKQLSAPTAKVWRDEKVVEVSATKIVIGDIFGIRCGISGGGRCAGLIANMDSEAHAPLQRRAGAFGQGMTLGGLDVVFCSGCGGAHRSWSCL